MTKPELSVIVATRDRPQALTRCLAVLARQRGVSLQVVVVDDGSRDVRAIAKAAGPDAILLHAPRRGVPAARNLGVERAEAPYVAFLDDDAEPEFDWAAILLSRLRAGAAAVVGPIVAAPGDRLGAASQLAANSLIDSDAASKGSTASAPAANLACSIELARAIPFDEAFAGLGAEDRDWCARLRATGKQLAFEPSAFVRHCQSLTLAEFLRRQYRYGRGARLYRLRHERGRLAPLRFYADLMRAGFRAGPTVGCLLAAAQIAAAAGYLRQWAARNRATPLGLSHRMESEAESRAA